MITSYWYWCYSFRWAWLRYCLKAFQTLKRWYPCCFKGHIPESAPIRLLFGLHLNCCCYCLDLTLLGRHSFGCAGLWRLSVCLRRRAADPKCRPCQSGIPAEYLSQVLYERCFRNRRSKSSLFRQDWPLLQPASPIWILWKDERYLFKNKLSQIPMSYLRETSRSVASSGMPSTYIVLVAFLGTLKVSCPNMA